MQMCGVFLGLGPSVFNQLVRNVSIGKLKTFQLYERFKLRARLAKLNSEGLRKAEPKMWTRIEEGDEEFATDLSQALLVSHMDMIIEVLDILRIPHQSGFFDKDIKTEEYLTDGWQQRVYDACAGKYPQDVLIFYINHLDWELLKSGRLFLPAETHAI
jgi:hypothetical protein